MQIKSFILFFLIFNISLIFSQEKGSNNVFPDDSIIVFQSPRPLLENDLKYQEMNSNWGLDLLLSDSGFGVGFFLQTKLNQDFLITSSLYISGARNSDEFEELIIDNRGYYSWQVRNKINRLFKFPLTIGLTYFPFKNDILENLKPFLSLGLGPTFILSTPYTYNRIPNGEIVGWFKSFGDAEAYLKFGGFIGIGSYFGNLSKNVLGVNIRYYYVPFGGDGLVSVIGLPIQNFGGLFLSLSIGTAF